MRRLFRERSDVYAARIAGLPQSLVDERRRIDISRLRPIGRLAGASYAYVHETFDMPRGTRTDIFDVAGDHHVDTEPFIVDITSTGSTLKANGLKILGDGELEGAQISVD